MDIELIHCGIETLLIGALVAGAASAAAAFFLTPDFGRGEQESGRTGNVRSAEEAQSIVYGWVTKGGVLSYINGTGEDNRFLHQMLILASHEVELIADLRLNGETVESVQFVGETQAITDHVNRVRDSVSRDASTAYDEHSRLNRMMGSVDQQIDPDALAENDNLTVNHRARGHAGVYSRYDYDQEVFTSFIPTLTAEVFGKKIFDPRDGETRWTYNPVLIIADLLESQFGVDRDQIDLETLIASADSCDEFIPSLNAMEPRYSANGVVELDGNWEDYLTPFINAMAGAVVEWGGQYFIHSGTWTEPVLTITDNDFMGTVSRQVSGSDQDRANSAKGTYISPSSYDQATEFPPVKDAVAIAEDGGRENYLELDLEMVNTHTQAQRIASILLQEARLDETIMVAVPLHVGLDLKPFDNIFLSSEIFGIEDTYRVVEHRLIPRSGRSGYYAIELNLKRHDESVYEWDPATQEKSIQNARTNLPGVGSTDPSLATFSLELNDSDPDHKAASVQVNWSDPSDPFERMEIEAMMLVECRRQDVDSVTEGDQAGEWEEVTISERREVAQGIQTASFDFESEELSEGPYEFRNHQITQARIRSRLSSNTFGNWINVRVS